MNEIEYIEYITPLEAKWLLVELPLPTMKTNHVRHKGTTLAFAKAFMAHLGYAINIDFKMSRHYHSEKVVLYLNPKHESYVSWIMLKWDPGNFL